MEWISIKPGFWGETGGHLLRLEFLKEAKQRGYSYATSYVHRNVVMRRIDKGESIQIVQKYDPDRLDYYRVDLNNILYLTSAISPTEMTHPDIGTMYIDENSAPNID